MRFLLIFRIFSLSLNRKKFSTHPHFGMSRVLFPLKDQMRPGCTDIEGIIESCAGERKVFKELPTFSSVESSTGLPLSTFVSVSKWALLK